MIIKASNHRYGSDAKPFFLKCTNQQINQQWNTNKRTSPLPIAVK
ncbi:hypothetical protein T4B_5288 [Trichinella pseudospiralis]|uniref:Uncharacterized protein n=1 Tax=Trichinella pseudospiralis TaxID=6337 RepID=A0A0V1GIQ1_TRIPS|nr:hypothetical protein T4B_5288 [Trichinella pseudospiralis]